MNFSRPGAIDLSAFKNPASGEGQSSDGNGLVVDVNEQNFQQIALEASLKHVVVLSLWSPRSPQSSTFNQLLASITASYAGQILLAQVDVDSNPAIAQAVSAQGVPMVLGLVKGQPVPLFQGTKDEADVRAYFDELVKVAAENGVSGRVDGPDEQPAEPEEEPDDPRFAAADEAFGAGDYATAISEYEKLAVQYPADDEITERLAGIKLLERTKDADLQGARQAAADNPDDVDAQLLVADLDVSGGHVEDAFVRLIDLIKKMSGQERDTLRERLLELFVVVGGTDPRVVAARRDLARALF